MFRRDTIRLELQLSVVHFMYLDQDRKKIRLGEFQLHFVHFACLCNNVHQRYNSVY